MRHAREIGDSIEMLNGYAQALVLKVSKAEMRVLLALASAHGVIESGSNSDLAQILNMDRSHTRRAKQSLERQGLVAMSETRITIREGATPAALMGPSTPRSGAVGSPSEAATASEGAAGAPARQPLKRCNEGVSGKAQSLCADSSSFSRSSHSSGRREEELPERNRGDSPRECAKAIFKRWGEDLASIPAQAPGRPIVHRCLKPEIVRAVERRLAEGYDCRSLVQAAERYLGLAAEKAEGRPVFCPDHWGLDTLLLRRENKSGPCDYVERLLQPNWRDHFRDRDEAASDTDESDKPEWVQRKEAAQRAEKDAPTRPEARPGAASPTLMKPTRKRNRADLAELDSSALEAWE